MCVCMRVCVGEKFNLKDVGLILRLLPRCYKKLGRQEQGNRRLYREISSTHETIIIHIPLCPNITAMCSAVFPEFRQKSMYSGILYICMLPRSRNLTLILPLDKESHALKDMISSTPCDRIYPPYWSWMPGSSLADRSSSTLERFPWKAAL